MPQDGLSFFDEKRGTVKAKTDWGYWWQTVQEVHVQVNLPEGTKSKEIKVDIKPNYIKCDVKGKTIFEGPFPRTVHAEESVWTLEDGVLCILLPKADYSVKEDMWESLIADGVFQPDPWTLHEMRKDLDLERFQIENPGMDFSKAKLSKNYDKLPGWSNERLAELKKKSEEVADKIGTSES
ncbi:UNVERIFIED_CONTAM: hypothetical protein PYX00_006768 [Menopon gallinae]|uniref:CS domain-containing protein n=1 Tax=Menopon gallinae TaxID=328185 RepID=A0AAW2HYB9_9NEOP